MIDPVSPQAGRAALERVLASATFQRAPRPSRLLRYIVQETLAGRADRLKEYVIGVDVCERGSDFDPKTDAIVRVDAGRLRTRLAEYYAGEGKDEPVVIELPKGGYVPEFRTVVRAVVQTAPDVAEFTPSRRTRWWPVGVGVLALLLAGSVVALFRLRRPPIPAPAVIARLPYLSRDCSFSPDGKRVAFSWSGVGDDNLDIYTVSTDGGAPQRLTSNPGRDLAPAWSPDGAWMAFERRAEYFGGSPNQVRVMSSNGGNEREITEIHTPLLTAHLEWSKDGKHLVTTHCESARQNCGLFEINVETGHFTRLTSPAESQIDVTPAVSPDGRRIAFVRIGPGKLASILTGAFTAAGDPAGKNEHAIYRAIYRTTGAIRGIAWTPGGGSIVFSSNEAGGYFRLRAVVAHEGAHEGATATVLPLARPEGLWPTVSRNGDLAYMEDDTSSTINEIDLNSPGVASPPARLISEARSQLDACFSPDGRTIAYASDQGGSMQIWLADASGAKRRQFTHAATRAAGPAWSPDGNTLAFEVSDPGAVHIYVQPLAAGPARAVTSGPFVDQNPSWTSDGRAIYFTSTRQGSGSTIFRIPVDGGEAAAVAGCRADLAMESPDGAWIYLLSRASGELDRMPVKGGSKTLIAMQTFYFAPVREGVWCVRVPNDKDQVIEFWRSSTERVERVITQPQQNLVGLSVSPDGKRLLLSQITTPTTTIELIRRFL